MGKDLVKYRSFHYATHVVMILAFFLGTITTISGILARDTHIMIVGVTSITNAALFPLLVYLFYKLRLNHLDHEGLE